MEPDIKIKEEPISQLAITLYTKNYFFDFASDYVHAHPTVASASDFALTDNDFDQFAKWLDTKDCSYKTETEDELDSLKEVAIKEKYYDNAKAEFDALQVKIAHDKKQDIQKHKDELMHMLESEIVSRYYYTRGRVAQGIKNDKGLMKALNTIESPDQYQALLVPKK